MPGKAWKALPDDERHIMLEAIRLYFIRMTTRLLITSAMKLQKEGYIRIVVIDAQDGQRSWIPELTPKGLGLAIQFLVVDPDDPPIMNPPAD